MKSFAFRPPFKVFMLEVLQITYGYVYVKAG